jgi:ComF family protein
MKTMKAFFEALLGLFYPSLCLACSTNLPSGNESLCLSCRYSLPLSSHHLDPENEFVQRFWGRIPLEAGAAMFYFSKGSKVQHMIHQLKYEGKKQIGYRLGEWYGRELSASPSFKQVDFIVPVPLHRKKEKKRGYNQSALFAAGLSSSMGVPWLERGLERVAFTETQTKKSREQRFGNVEQAFRVPHPAQLEGKHILLVDDVITTGATLEACGRCILDVPDTRLLLATIAFAG